jgi:hypothetical protein
MNTLSKILIGAGVVVGGYQLYKYASKPKNPPKSGEIKSSASGKKLQAGMLKYDKGHKKVFKLLVDGFDSRWVMLNKKDQPKPFEWYNLNGKWVWTKYDGSLAV